MTYVSVPAASLDRASTMAIDIAQFLVELEANATAQGQLDLFGADQACEAFMIERKELQDRIDGLEFELDQAKAMIRQEIDSQRTYRQGVVTVQEQLDQARTDRDLAIDIANAKGSEVATANAVLLHVSDFANELQARLNLVGISFRADEDGAPTISVNLDVLTDALFSAHQRELAA